MDSREQRGLVIAALCKLGNNGGRWFVPSQSDSTKCYTVDPQGQSCTCPDHADSGHKCKHLFAVEFTLKRETNADGSITETKSITFTEKKKYTQDWPTYNLAQSVEKNRFQKLLHDLCGGISDTAEPSPEGGRPRLPVRERLFAAIMKVYSTFSSRRFSSDLTEAKESGFVQNSMHWNQVTKYLNDADTTAMLKKLVERSALPLKSVEVDFAVDSTGFTCSKFYRWFDEKYGKNRSTRGWVKAHVICGVRTGIICNAEITDQNTNDCPILPRLVMGTARNFRVRDVSADKGYLSSENVDTIHGVGGTAYIAPKSNTTGAVGGLFGKMIDYYHYRREDFLNHYHQRSNVESVFSSVKRKFGDNVRSKKDAAMRNEVLAKIVCHNICTVIKSQVELGVETEFWGCAENTAISRVN